MMKIMNLPQQYQKPLASDTLDWQIKMPSQVQMQIQKKEPWLNEVSELRGQVLYQNGLRPQFKLPDGHFYDQDEFEGLCYHILAYQQDRLIGAIRLLPLKPPFFHSISSYILGENQFQELLEGFLEQKHACLDSTHFMEFNCLVVHPDYKHLNLGIRLCALAWVIASKLNYTVFANANKKLIENYYIKYMGAEFFPKNSGPYFSPLFNDKEVYLFYIDKDKMSRYFLEQVEKVEQEVTIPMTLQDVMLVDNNP